MIAMGQFVNAKTIDSDFHDGRIMFKLKTKDLHSQTTDKSNYDLVVDAIEYKGNKDKLKNFIRDNPLFQSVNRINTLVLAGPL